MITTLLRIALYVVSVLVSVNYADDYWVVGPVFGLTVVGWDSGIFRKVAVGRHAAYLAASASIYALVYHISRQRWDRGSDLNEALIGSLSIAVIVGSVLLPIAHQFFLKPAGNVLRVIPQLIISYYALSFLSLANGYWNLGWDINFLFVMIALWQGAYLYFFFAKKS